MRIVNYLIAYGTLLYLPIALGTTSSPVTNVSTGSNGFLDENVDYANFTGRVTDRDPSGNILKIKVENNNVKFFRAGDRVTFTIGENGEERCDGSIKGVEDFYFTIYVKNLKTCIADDYYFRRGTFVKLYSDVLFKRIQQSSNYRKLLLLKKEDFLKQLSKINHFLWSFDQEKVKTVADYDAQILDIQREKQQALDNLLIKKQEQTLLQLSLQRKLDEIDNDLNHYMIERQEMLFDRWAMDQDLGLPVENRPQDLIPLSGESKRVLNDHQR